MTRSANVIARIATFLLVLIAAFGTTAYAQDFKCACDNLRIEVGEKVACAVTLCVQESPSGPLKCAEVNPGNSVEVACPPYALGVQLCDGSIAWIIHPDEPVLGLCNGIGQVGPKCCVRVCRVLDEKTGCPVLSIQPEPCLTTCDY